MIFLIVDDNASYLFSMCQILKDSCTRLLAIQCGETIDNYSLMEIEKLDIRKIKTYQINNEEDLLLEKKINPIIDVLRNDQEYRIILDIVLSDKQRIEENIFKKRSSYADYGSVRFATFLVEKKNIKKEFITFYSRPEALPIYKKRFIEDTISQNWNSPMSRPSFCGLDETIKTNYFISRILHPLKLGNE